ncbi:uncharacterized protein BJ212DRAFT_1271086 [Suillus subaureus]|uniref:Uncharacterized protein n=1 Tax=Suillus subaureus TaxID=48587 RepID=A0A9P7EBW9_9AGAM|nr:uncharacterized protein BJ212DRAFT_1271086 [Suillus subaureus]KAG1816752.1 hypothetical protein BJ212DRAFT_1271086 [Suillus subaureus]
MLKTAKKLNLSFVPPKLSKNLKMQLPTWFHLGAPPKTYNKSKDKCLQTNHETNTIKDLLTTSKRIHTNTTSPKHSPRKNCACQACKTDRNNGCLNPHKCAASANMILNKLNQKLNPLAKSNTDDLTLTHHRKEKTTKPSQQ